MFNLVLGLCDATLQQVEASPVIYQWHKFCVSKFILETFDAKLIC